MLWFFIVCIIIIIAIGLLVCVKYSKTCWFVFMVWGCLFDNFIYL